MVSETQKEAIRKEARVILDNFAKALGKAPSPKDYVRTSSEQRAEGQGMECDNDFRARLLDNAPNKTGDCIVSEKGKWI